MLAQLLAPPHLYSMEERGPWGKRLLHGSTRQQTPVHSTFPRLCPTSAFPRYTTKRTLPSSDGHKAAAELRCEDRTTSRRAHLCDLLPQPAVALVVLLARVTRVWAPAPLALLPRVHGLGSVVLLWHRTTGTGGAAACAAGRAVPAGVPLEALQLLLQGAGVLLLWVGLQGGAAPAHMAASESLPVRDRGSLRAIVSRGLSIAWGERQTGQSSGNRRGCGARPPRTAKFAPHLF